MVLKITGSLFIEEMSCCDCCGLKSKGLESMPNTSKALLIYFKYLLVFKDQLRTYFSKYNFLVATKQFNIFQNDHDITAKAEFFI